MIKSHTIYEGVDFALPSILGPNLELTRSREIRICREIRNNGLSFNTRHKYTLTTTSNTYQVNQQQQAWEKRIDKYANAKTIMCTQTTMKSQ